MSDDRELILGKVKKALEPLPERAPKPDWQRELVTPNNPSGLTGWERFCEKLEAVHGNPVTGLDALGKWMHEEGLTFGYCDPFFKEKLSAHPAFSGIQFETTFEVARIDDYAFGITRASGGISESGTIILKDGESSSRLGALAPWVHIAILHPSRLLDSITDAVLSFGDDPSVIWATGPSKTADVEGILIEGVHGPGVQVCCLTDEL